MSEKENLTKEELLLLHLLNYNNDHEDYMAPEQITMEGIKNVIKYIKMEIM